MRNEKASIDTDTFWERKAAHTKVAEGAGGSGCGRVAVFDSCHVQQLLGHGPADNARTTGSRDQAHQHTAAPAGDLQKKEQKS